MPESEDTPGPWRASWSTEGQSWSILNEDGHMIANAFESETNARRMAAAPDMEKALEECVTVPGARGEYEHPCPQCARQMRDAIAKAKGEADA